MSLLEAVKLITLLVVTLSCADELSDLSGCHSGTDILASKPSNFLAAVVPSVMRETQNYGS